MFLHFISKRMFNEPAYMPLAPLFPVYFTGCDLKCSKGRFSNGLWCEWADKCPHGHRIGKKWFRKYRGGRFNGVESLLW